MDKLNTDRNAGEPNSMRVLYVWDADYPWDIRTEKIARALTAAGFEVHIAARNKAWRASAEQLPEGCVHRMPPWRLLGKRIDNLLGFPAFFSPRWLRLLRRIISENHIDVVIVRDLPLCPTAIWVSRLHGIPVVCDMAEDYPGMMRATWEAKRQGPFDFVLRNPRAVAAVERYCVPRLDRLIVTVAEAGERLVAAGADRERISVVHNSPPVRQASCASAPIVSPGNARSTRIVYLGILEIPRGIGELLNAMAILQRSNHDFDLTIIGAGRDESLFREQAASLGLGPELVTFTGFVPHAEAIRLVAESDIGANPLHDSPVFQTCIPNKLFDYMAAGLAVLSSDVKACARLLDETGAGEVFRAGDPESLAAALTRLSDPATRRRMGALGKAAVVQQYNWEADSQELTRTVEALRRR